MFKVLATALTCLASTPAWADDILSPATVFDIFAIETTDPQVILDAFRNATQDEVVVRLLTTEVANDGIGQKVLYLDLMRDQRVHAGVSCNWLRAPVEPEMAELGASFGSDFVMLLTAPLDGGTTLRLNCTYNPFFIPLAQVDSLVADANEWVTANVAAPQPIENAFYDQSFIAVNEDARAQGDVWGAAIQSSALEPYAGLVFETVRDIKDPEPTS